VGEEKAETKIEEITNDLAGEKGVPLALRKFKKRLIKI
jgi:hypothetical protein